MAKIRFRVIPPDSRNLVVGRAVGASLMQSAAASASKQVVQRPGQYAVHDATLLRGQYAELAVHRLWEVGADQPRTSLSLDGLTLLSFRQRLRLCALPQGIRQGIRLLRHGCAYLLLSR